MDAHTRTPPPRWQGAALLVAMLLALVLRGPADTPVQPDMLRDRVDAAWDIGAEPARLRGPSGTWGGGVHGGAWPLHL